MDIRLIGLGEEDACNQFHNRIYKDDRTLAQWCWEFVENTYDRAPVPYAVVSDAGRIVGTQAFIPIRLIDADGVFWTAKSEETLVDPDYRGQKLFEKMYALLFDYAEEHRFAYIWGFTPAIKAFARLDFTIPGTTDQLFLPFASSAIASMLKKSEGRRAGGTGVSLKRVAVLTGGVLARLVSAGRLAISSAKPPAGVTIKTLEQPPKDAAGLCKRFVSQWGGTTIYRDAAYMQWRLFDNPYVRSIVRAAFRGDQLIGWVAYTLGDDGLGYLVDVLVADESTSADPAGVIRALLRDAVIGTRNMGATAVRGWSVNNHPFDRFVSSEARKLGFYHVKRGHSVVLYNCSEAQKRPSYGRFDDWYVSRVYTEGVLS